MVIEQLDPAYTHTAIAGINDILHFKALVNGTVRENWVRVDNIKDDGTHYEYTGTRLSGMPWAFPIGTTFVNYGASGEGVIRFDTEDTWQPYMEVLTHAGAPYSTVTRHLVVGRLRSFTGADEYGLTIGADLDAFADNYLVLSEDRFLLNRNLNVATGKGFQFDDGGVAGWALVDDGTGLYTPGAIGGAGLPVPSGEGYILRSNAVPAFVEYYAGTLGGVLIGNGTTVVSDTSPTLVGNLTMDDGIGNSPLLLFVGGTNDDTALFYLQDDAVAGNSDMALALCANDADSRFLIRNANLTNVAWIDATGAASFNSVVAIRSSGDETTEADIWLDGNGAISAEGSLFVLIDSDNSTNSAIFEIAKNADARQEGVSGTSLWKITEDNKQVMRLSTVGHGATSIFEHSDAFYQVSNVTSTSGGALISGGADNSVGDGGGALVLRGVLADNANTTRSSAGRALVEVYGSQVSGTSFGDIVANGNVFNIRARKSSLWSTVFIVDEDGDQWLSGKIDASDAGIQTMMSTANTTDLAPTDAELDAAFGTPATVGAGFHAFVDDNGSHARVWFVTSDGTNWWYSRMYIAV